MELSCGRHLTFKLFKDTIRKICSTNGIIQLSKPRTDIFFSLRFLLLEDGWKCPRETWGEQYKTWRRNRKMLSFSKFFFFLSFFFVAKSVSFFQSSMSVKRSAILQRQKNYLQLEWLPQWPKASYQIFKQHLQIKINIFWKSLLDTVHCAFQTFQIVKINQPLLFWLKLYKFKDLISQWV